MSVRMVEKVAPKFNLEKCHVIHIGHKSNTKYYLHRDGQRCEIAVSRLEKYLEIKVSDDLKWSTQCSKAAKKTMSVLEMIKITFPYLDREGFILLYNIGPIWNTVCKCGIRIEKKTLCLEKVQRRAAKMLYELKHLEYDERLHRLGLYTLQYRRRDDLIKEITQTGSIHSAVHKKR